MVNYGYLGPIINIIYRGKKNGKISKIGKNKNKNKQTKQNKYLNLWLKTFKKCSFCEYL